LRRINDLPGENMTRFIAAVFATALGTACATTGPAPRDRLAASEASYRGAQEAGAAGSPQANLHLKLAADEIAQARALMAQEKNEEAGRTLERARADAELAVGLAREAQARNDAQAAVDQVKALQDAR
jgi:hypothetical protein